MNKTTWQLKNEAQENAFARRLLVEYNIKEVTTQRQAKNETRVFEFPVSARKHTHHSKNKTKTSSVQIRLCKKSEFLLI